MLGEEDVADNKKAKLAVGGSVVISSDDAGLSEQLRKSK